MRIKILFFDLFTGLLSATLLYLILGLYIKFNPSEKINVGEVCFSQAKTYDEFRLCQDKIIFQYKNKK